MFATVKDSKDNADNAKDRMANEGGHTMDEAKASARRFRGEAKEAAHAVKEDLEDVARHTGRRARDLVDSAEDNLEDWNNTLIEKVQDKPIQSLLIAGAVGFVLSMFLRRN